VTPEGSQHTQINRNELGWAISTYRPAFGYTFYTCDNWGRVDTVTNTDSSTVSVDYDLEDTVTAVTDENGHSTTFAYDDALRLTSTTNGRGDVESYGYNTNGWVTSVTNGRGKTRTYEYTLRGDSKKMVLPDGYFENSSFDGNGNATAYDNSLLRNVLQTIQYGYNQLDQITGINYPNDADVSFTYDSLRRIDLMVDGTGTTDWTYNDRGFLSALSTPQGNQSYTYDLLGRRLTMVDSTGSTTYAYDTYQRPRSVTNPHNETTLWDYDSNGILIKQTLSTGSKTEYGFDSRGRTTSVVHKKNNNSVISSESYVFDGTGNMTAKTVDSVMTTYAYDNADQLTSESRPGYVASYSYDGNGNRLAKVLNGVTEAYTYDDGDKMLTAGTKSYQYDLAGRTAQVTSPSGVTSVTYDDEDRVTRVYNQSQSINQSYRYNGLDTRVQRLDNNAVTRTYRRDGVSPTAQVLADGTATFTPGISERRGGVSKFLHQDYLGSTKQITTSNQTVTDSKKYDAFGLLQPDSTGSTPTPFGFAGAWGYQQDSTGLQLLGHRYYDPSTGRFLTRDPIGDGSNWYTYASNNPVCFVDENGLWVQFAAAIVAMFILSSDVAIAPAGPLDPSESEKIKQAKAELAELKFAAFVASIGGSASAIPRYNSIRRVQRFVPNPHGRKGNPQTQQRVREIEKETKEKHPEWEVEAGGTMPERNVPTPGGNRNSRGPDLIFRKPNGERRFVQVGRTTKKGKPVAREKKALDDLRRVPGSRTKFYPLNKK
jgi:RHS repeat-associated protein